MSAVKRFTGTTDPVAKPPILVAGGGIAGLATAAALAQRGATVEVHERAPDLRTQGAGIQISPNGARVLHGLGLKQAFDACSLKSRAVVPVDGLTGREIARFDLPVPGFYLIPRANLLRLLSEACTKAGVTIRTGSALSPDTPRPPGLLIAADGLRSGFRRLLNGAADPFFTGQVAWRAMVPGSAPPEARIWMLPGRHVVTYPLPGDRINIVAVQERTDWAAEGWSHEDDPQNLRAAFADAAPALTGLLAQVDRVNLWGLFRHEVAPFWVGDSFALVGDAAHPTLPFLAQGANLALEDAWVLARCLTDASSSKAGLTTYETLRRARAVRAIAAANANARNYHLMGFRRWVAHAGLRGIGALAPQKFLGRYDWLYDHDVTA